MNPLQYIVTFARAAGGAIIDGLIARPNFNDMANLSLTSPSNGSATFNGTSDYVLSPADVTSGTLSVGAWCYYDGSKSTNTLLNFQPHQTLGISLNRLGGNEIHIYIGNGSSWLATPAINVTAGQPKKWFYLAFTADGTTSRLYIDGSLVGSYAGVPTGISTASFPIGAVFTGSYTERFAGNLANVAFWNRALTSDEINSIQWKRYDLLTSGESTGLVAWYALDDITGTSVPDSTGTYNATAY